MGMSRIITSHQAFGATLGGLIAASAAVMDTSPVVGCSGLAIASTLCLAKLA